MSIVVVIIHYVWVSIYVLGDSVVYNRCHTVHSTYCRHMVFKPMELQTASEPICARWLLARRSIPVGLMA